jgi:hypothetical protein
MRITQYRYTKRIGITSASPIRRHFTSFAVYPVISAEGIYEAPETSSNTPSLHGNRVVIYLDDILLLYQDKEELRMLFDKVLEHLQNLGFTIKQEKCSSAPTQSLVFLGGLLISVNMTISLPSEKLNAITKAAQEMQKDREVTDKVLSSFLGRLSHAAQMGVWTAPLHYRSIQ